MQLTTLDWALIGAYFVLALGVGLWASRQAKSDAAGYFLAGRNMPWWLLGISMVATTFSTDTPNLVTDLVRQQGVAGNWAWWAFLLTGMVTVFVYARLWRRSGVLTDISFYELRYGGKSAAFLRGFRALYLGLVFNVLVMATVSLAAIKLGSILLGWPGWLTLLVTCSITLVYSVLGGLRAVILTDFVQFILAMVGSVWAAWWIVELPEIGGLKGLLNHPSVVPQLDLVPDLTNPDAWIPMLLIPLAVQWWSSYYPGAEPGGGGYIAQRMFSAKDEGHAVGATLLFNVAHYALRPWPWILVALASLIVFPDLASLQEAFPHVAEDKVGHDLAYPAMLSLLPPGLLGLVAASLLAAFMSTMSTQLNLGASYLVHDFYGRFIRPEATERQRVVAGQLATGFSLVLGAGLGLSLTDAGQAFNLLLLLGAGTGGLFLLRWFWWRISAATEISAMVISLVVAMYFTWIHDALSADPLAWVPVLESWEKLLWGTALTTGGWVATAWIFQPESQEVLTSFVAQTGVSGPGWRGFARDTSPRGHSVSRGLLQAFLGCVSVYGALMATGSWLYGHETSALWLVVLALLAALGVFSLHRQGLREHGMV
ncbi:MAG: Na+:solute symporter [Bacteroidetes bacterium]|nr:Na+:solute symporter [Bacteroidota bacterium]MDA0903497.1 Na+:solute symporter [Bacteroidota bacterium]MDA1241918.1 Na+:solute symporter [Bacteroidota bacterium]